MRKTLQPPHLAAESTFSLKKIAIAAFGPSLLFNVGQGAILPVIALSARAGGASVAAAGLIAGLIGIGSLVSNLPAALLIARYGERLAMVWAAVLSLIGLSLCLTPQRIWLLAVGVFLIGMATSVLLLARQTYLVELVPLHVRARAMSMLGGMRRIGVFAGPLLGAVAMHFLGLSGAYWIAIVAIAGSGLLAWTIPDLDRTQTLGTPQPTFAHLVRAHWKVYCTIGLGILLVSAMRASRRIIIPLWAEHLGISPAATSIIYGAVASIDMLMFYPSGKAMDQYGRFWVAVPSMTIMGISTVLVPFTTGLSSFTASLMAIAFGNGLASGLVMTLGADVSPSMGRTQFLGTWRLISDLGASGAPALLAAITAMATLASGITVTGLLGLLAAVVFWRWLPHSGAPHA